MSYSREQMLALRKNVALQPFLVQKGSEEIVQKSKISEIITSEAVRIPLPAFLGKDSAERLFFDLLTTPDIWINIQESCNRRIKSDVDDCINQLYDGYETKLMSRTDWHAAVSSNAPGPSTSSESEELPTLRKLTMRINLDDVDDYDPVPVKTPGLLNNFFHPQPTTPLKPPGF